jgi:adenylate kinase family enzyme
MGNFYAHDLVHQTTLVPIMPIVFRELDLLISHFEGKVRAGEIISIDGIDGSGKTYLAMRLAQELGAEHVEVDSFLDRNRGGYVPFIRYEELARCLDDFLRAGRSVVIDGVCMESVLARLGKAPTCRVYVKRMGPGPPSPYWKDESDFAERTPEEVIEGWARSAQVLNEMWATTEVKTGSGALDKEVLQYHHEQRPHERADVIYERIEE